MLRSLDAWVIKLDGVVEPRVAESVDEPGQSVEGGELRSRSERDIEVLCFFSLSLSPHLFCIYNC